MLPCPTHGGRGLTTHLAAPSCSGALFHPRAGCVPGRWRACLSPGLSSISGTHTGLLALQAATRHGFRPLRTQQQRPSAPLHRPGPLPRLGLGLQPCDNAGPVTTTARPAWGPAGRLETAAAPGSSTAAADSDASLHLVGGHPLMLSAVSSVDGDYTRGASSDSDDERRAESSGEWASTSGLPSQAATGHSKATYEVLRLDKHGRARHVKARRRDLCKEHRLQPRDLRRIDPSVDVAKTPPSITIKDNVLLLCLGGVRAIVTAEKALLFEPQQPASRKFLEVVQQHLQARQQAGQQALLASLAMEQSHEQYMSRYYQRKGDQAMTPAFELEVMESALMVATGHLEGEMGRVTQRIQTLLTKLPIDINPVNLEELRKVKGALVELEQKADTLRNMLEEVLDDEDELKELNLTNRPRREERRRQRERERLERELERAREIKEEIEERLEGDDQASAQQNLSGLSNSSGSGSNNASGGSSSGQRDADDEQGQGDGVGTTGKPTLDTQGGLWNGRIPGSGSLGSSSNSSNGGASGQGGQASYGLAPGHSNGNGSSSSNGGYGAGGSSANSSNANGSGNGGSPAHDASSQQQLPGSFRAQKPDPHGHLDAHTLGPWRSVSQAPASNANPPSAIATMAAAAASAAVVAAVSEEHNQQTRMQELRSKFDRARLAELRARFNWGEGERDRDRDMRRRSAASGDDLDYGREGWMSRLSGSEEDIQEAQEALEEMVEQEEEEQEIEEVEDLIEYYLQRASATKDEAERLLAGARDLEESIGISLSARRFEVNRLELTLSIGSFAAALGALVAGIFGMNMRSCLEMSVAGFWGVTAAIMLGCCLVFAAILAYTRRKRIL